MKRIITITIAITVAAAICVLPACKKTNEYPSHTATVSFPIVTLVGSPFVTINRGATFVDSGATWRDTVTGESGTIKAQAINTSVDSAYYLIYTATNKNGFKSSVARGLGVTNYNGPIDISGGYVDGNGNQDTLVKVSRALFYNPDVDMTYNNPYFPYYSGDPGVTVIKSDSTISSSTVYTLATGTVGAPLVTTLSNASITYQAPYIYTGTPPHQTPQPTVIFSYNVNILNVPSFPATFTHDLQ